MRAGYEHVPSMGERASFAFRTWDVAAFPFRWHFHPEYEVTLIDRGSGQRFVGDDIGEYRAGDVVLLGPGLPHTWYTPPSPSGSGPLSAAAVGWPAAQRSVVVQFTGDCLGTGFFDRPELTDVRRLLDRAAVGLAFDGRGRAEAARRVAGMATAGPLSRLTALLDTLGVLADADARPLSTPGFTPALRTGEHQRVDRVCAAVNDALYTAGGQTLRVADAARLVHLSESAFARLFRRATGKTYTAYVNELRVGVACRRLAETDDRIGDVAFAAGFENLSNFNRRFAALKGMTPRAYRRQFGVQ